MESGKNTFTFGKPAPPKTTKLKAYPHHINQPKNTSTTLLFLFKYELVLKSQSKPWNRFPSITVFIIQIHPYESLSTPINFEQDGPSFLGYSRQTIVSLNLKNVSSQNGITSTIPLLKNREKARGSLRKDGDLIINRVRVRR